MGEGLINHKTLIPPFASGRKTKEAEWNNIFGNFQLVKFNEAKKDIKVDDVVNVVIREENANKTICVRLNVIEQLEDRYVGMVMTPIPIDVKIKRGSEIFFKDSHVVTDTGL